jgi:malate permease and related proteins
MASVDAFAKVLPILLLFGLGAFLRYRGALKTGTLEDLRWLVLNVTLPAALFLTFLRVSLEPQYALIVVAVFGACLGALLAGPFLGRLVGVPSPMLPYLLTGFEAGMLGYAVYGAVFGQDALYRFAIVDIGQVTFVFFVLATLLARRAGGRAPGLAATALAFVRTPVILAIVAGMAGSAVGLGTALDANPFGDALLRTLALLAAITTPVIAIVIGASTSLRRGSLSAPVRTVALRMTAWVVLALLFNALVVDRLLGLDRLFQAAVLTMAVLPPPFVIPLYLRAPADGDEEAERDHRYTVNTLSVATLATLVAIVAVSILYAP